MIIAYPVFVCKSQNAKEKFHSENQANWHRKLKIEEQLKFNTCNKNLIPEILDSSDAYPQAKNYKWTFIGCIHMKVHLIKVMSGSQVPNKSFN